MDIATLIGIISGASLVVVSIIMGGTPKIFFNIPSILIVVGGSTAATFIKFPMKTVFGTFKVATKAFLYKLPPTDKIIDEIVECAEIARKNGLLALEDKETSDPFLKQAITYCVDGYEGEFIEEIMGNEIQLLKERHEVGQKVFKAFGDAAPAFGMIGTLIGLVQMLTQLDDPKKIGPAMAVALLTTLYGSLLANLFALPIAEKLEYRSNEEVLLKRLILDGVLSIQKGVSPRVIRENLQTYLPPKLRKAEGR